MVVTLWARHIVRIELFQFIVIRRFEVVVRAIGRSLFMVLTTYFDVCTHFMFEQREGVGRPAARACTSYIYEAAVDR